MSDSHPSESPQKISLIEAFFNRRMLACILMGFSSGLPLYLLLQLIPAWLRSEGVNLKTIGMFALLQLPYTWKFLWAPMMDRFIPPLLGRRRGWALITQILLMLLIGGLGFFSPKQSIWTIAYLCMIVSFFSASQDIVLDAYRREILPDHELGLGSSMFVNAYRVAGLIPGGVSLVLADRMPWSSVFVITAAFMLIGVIASFLAPEPKETVSAPTSIKDAVIEPFKEFFTRNGVQSALLILAFLFLYKLGDTMATSLSTPFYLDVGFTKTQIGTIAKLVGLWASIAGGVVGGLLMVRIGINRALWVFGLVQIVTILGFAVLSEAGPSPIVLGVVVGLEYLGVGLGSAAFVAFMARSTNKAFTATQYALLTSFMAVPRTLVNASTGYIVESTGWTNFFYLCTLLAIPGMLLLIKVAPWGDDPEEDLG
ncbi:MAG: AmpG family muropeptide MFS transporter [Deltaproteobacteria bacterium]|nr:AmpG family muropeptide MFS transporter [Deltaproteobacteria bacterium]|tara:strand:- start:3636 stop:4913 length:1278 start_codon:yes stop_codon:yes gene_type:complete